MAGRHFKGDGSDAETPLSGSGRSGGAAASGSASRNDRKPVDPGETAMFIAMHEQSHRADSVATSGRAKIPEGGPRAQQPEVKLPPVTPRGAQQADDTVSADGPAPASGGTPLPRVNRTAAPAPDPEAEAGQTMASQPVDFDATSDMPAFSAEGPEFEGSGSKEEFYDFNLPYGGNGEDAGVTEDGLVRHRHHKEKKTGRIVGTIVLVVLLVLIVAGGVGGFMLFRSAKSVQANASSAVSLVSGLKDKLTSGDFSALPDDAKKIDSLCSSIEAETDSPLWAVASYVPVVGSDISAARTLVDALADVSSDGLVPMASKLADATPGKLIQAGGTVNVSAIQAVADSLASSSKVFENANDRVQAIGDTHIPQVTKLVKTAKDGFGMLDGAVSAAKQVAPVLPQMLGANGQTRNYLVIAENNVEIRARGGFGGSQGVISVTDGKMSVGEFKAATTVGDDQKLETTQEENILFNAITGHMGTNSGDALYTPDFPRAASLASQMWEIQYNQHIDGVVALDPVFLQYLLGLVGSVSLPDGTVVDDTNAAKVLMHDVYWNYPVAETDGIFASVASAAFDKIMNGMGDVDMTKLVFVFEKGCEQGRFIAWMSDAQEESALKEMGISAALPSAKETSAAPVTGVYVNNYSFSKIDWYLNLNSEVGVGTQAGDGSCSYQVTTTLTSTLKKSEVDKLPDYVANSVYENGKITNRGNERLGVYLYAPAGGTITDVQVNGSDLKLTAAKHNGLDVQYGIVDLQPEETCTITYKVVTSKESGDKPLTVQMTPTCQTARDGSTD